jgi:hypothetical protein
MKQNFIIVLLAFGISSCEYNNSPPTKSSSNQKDTLVIIEGKWTVEKDSFLIGSLGINHLKTDSDYYDFGKDGILLIKEGLRFDTAIYALNAENSIAIRFKEKLIVNRLPSGNYLVNKVSDSLLSLTASGTVNAPEISQGISVVISLRKKL